MHRIWQLLGEAASRKYFCGFMAREADRSLYSATETLTKGASRGVKFISFEISREFRAKKLLHLDHFTIDLCNFLRH